MSDKKDAPAPEPKCACGHDWPDWAHTPTGCKPMRYNPATGEHDLAPAPSERCAKCGEPRAMRCHEENHTNADCPQYVDCHPFIERGHKPAPAPEPTLTCRHGWAAQACAECDRERESNCKGLLTSSILTREDLEHYKQNMRVASDAGDLWSDEYDAFSRVCDEVLALRAENEKTRLALKRTAEEAREWVRMVMRWSQDKKNFDRDAVWSACDQCDKYLTEVLHEMEANRDR